MAKIARPMRPLLWVASSKRDYRAFPPPVQDNLGFALFLVQTGQHPPSAKPLKGLSNGTVELVEDFDGDTYRAVYTVRFKAAVYVLHAFKKKSKRGIATHKSIFRRSVQRFAAENATKPRIESMTGHARADIDRIERRLKDAARDYAERFTKEKKS